MSASNLSTSSVLGDPRLWRDLARTVRRRIDHVEVDDVVQSTLAEALAAKALPTAEEEIRRFVFAIARQKVADVYRRRERERRRELREPSELGELATAEPAPSNDVKRWVEGVLPRSPDATRTFEWMLRESEGETLAAIAAADRVSAAMVRQRVSRLRRWLRARWAKELAAVTMLAIVAVGVALVSRRGPTATNDPHIVREPDAPAPPDSRPAEMTAPAPRDLRPRPLPRRGPVVPPPVLAPLPSAAPSASASGSAPRAQLNHITTTVRDPDGTTRTATDVYEVRLPSLDLKSCVTPSTPKGVSQITVSFREDGSVDTARVDGGVALGRPEARCVERLYAKVRTRAFTGGPVSGAAYFSLVPEPPPAWARPAE